MWIDEAFKNLEIEITRDEAQIVKAYRQLLPKYNPEDDPEGFKSLRMAYETALKYAKKREPSFTAISIPKEEVVIKQLKQSFKEEKPDDAYRLQAELDIWMDKVNDLYQDIRERGNAEKWKLLLNDDVCLGLDTYIDARKNILNFLMSHYYLPQDVWRIINGTFQIVTNIPVLEEQFPEDFLAQIKSNVENKNFLPYDLFKYVGLDEKNIIPDLYIKQLLDIKDEIDAGDYEGCLDKLNELENYGIYHPYEDVERLKIYINIIETENAEIRDEAAKEALVLIGKLSELTAIDVYAHTYSAEAMWWLGKKDEAYALWSRILEENSNAYYVKFCLARHYYGKGLYEKADELVSELVELNNEDKKLHQLLININEELIKRYKTQIENDNEEKLCSDKRLMLKLGWKLLQNGYIAEGICLADAFVPDATCECEYYRLYGRLLYESNEYEKALYYLEKWNELLYNNALPSFYIALCLLEKGNRKASKEKIEHAIELENRILYKLQYMRDYAARLVKYKFYKEAVDLCDRIIKIDVKYYPAYLIRQEAFFELRWEQYVIDDYEAAIRIRPKYYKPYFYGASMYFITEKYDNCLDVLERARENDVPFTLNLLLLETRLLRKTARDPNEREFIFEKLNDIEQLLKNTGAAASDIDEVDCERALLYLENKDYAMACDIISNTIKKQNCNPRCFVVMGDILSDEGYPEGSRRFEKAIHNYKIALTHGMEDDSGVNFSLGYCYEKLGNAETANSYYKEVYKIQGVYRDVCERLINFYLQEFSEKNSKYDVQQALKYAEKQLEYKRNSYSLMLMGRVYEHGINLEKAVEFYKEALENDGENYIVWNYLGDCYRRLMDFEQAIVCFENSIKFMGNTKASQPYRNIAICYEALAEYDRAIQYYKQALVFSSEKEVLWNDIGDCYLYMSYYDEAMRAYRYCSTINMYVGQAKILYAKGKRNKAKWVCRNHVMEYPFDEYMKQYKLHGDFYLEYLQDYDGAIQYYSTAIYYCNRMTRGKMSKDWIYKLDIAMVKAYYLAKNEKKAKMFAELALKQFGSYYNFRSDFFQLSPYQCIYLADFGMIYLGLGNIEKAKDYFLQMEEAALCINCRYKGCYKAKLFLGIMYYRQGNISLANEAFEEALKRNPHDEFTKYLLKAVKKKLKKRRKALEGLE